MEELEPLLKELGPLFKLLVLWAFKGHNFWLAVAGVVSLFAFALIISLLRALFKKAELVPFRETESRPPVNFPVEGNSLDRGQDFNFCKLCEQRVEHVGEICVSCRARTLSGTLSIKDPLPPADWLSGIPDAARPRLLPRLRPEPCQYGLTLERWRYFHGEKSGKPWTRFCPFLFWASFAVLVLLKPPPSAFFVFLALFALAAIVVVQLEKAISRLSKRRKESQHDYQNYARYERDCEQYYQGLHLLKLEEQKAELRELRRREEALRREESWWQQLGGSDFERELAALLAKRGFQVKQTGGRGDEGIDLVVSAIGKTMVVQCKAHAAYIGPGPVRELYGSLIHVGADEGWLVTTSGFSLSAREFARDKPIRLLTVREILDMEDMPKKRSRRAK